MERQKDTRELGALLDIFSLTWALLAGMTPPMGLRSKCHCAAATSQLLNTGIDKLRVIRSQLMYTTLETWFGRNFLRSAPLFTDKKGTSELIRNTMGSNSSNH